jgi:hypothetical protein
MSDQTDPILAAKINANRAHAEIIGTVASTWNGAQESLFFVFVALMGMRKSESEAIFFTLKADSAQRDITDALAKVVLAENSDLLKRVSASIKAMNLLAGERNAAIHTMWRTALDEARVIPSPDTKPHGALKPDHRTQFFELAAKLADLDGEIFDLVPEIRQHLASRDKRPQ